MRGVALPLALLTGCALLAGCATTPVGLPPVAVTAVAETAPVGTANADAADDPAVWRNAANPLGSLIVATDKKAGLYVYGLDGAVRSFFDAGLVNNVDLVDMGASGVIVVASDRNDLANAKLQVFRLDTAAARLDRIAVLDGGAGEGYGLCLMRQGADVLAYSVLKDGTVHESRIALAGAAPTAQMLRTFKIPTQTEGCVLDPRDGTLFVGEETAGIWRFAAGETTGRIVAPIDNQYLVADVEGLALVTEGTSAGYLVASSQGDNAYAVFRLPGIEPVGRFRIAAGKFGATEETDGIELIAGDFGPDYPAGLFVAQDGKNAPGAQNFKFASWAAIKAALGIR
jgi:3-phytase